MMYMFSVGDLSRTLLTALTPVAIIFIGLVTGLRYLEKFCGAESKQKTHGESGDDWLSEQLVAERQAKRRTSTMLGIDADSERGSAAERLREEHERNCAADRLRYAHAENCDAEAVREDSARATRQEEVRAILREIIRKNSRTGGA